MRRPIAFLVATISFAACTHRPPEEAPRIPPPRGEASFRSLADASTVDLAPDEVFVAPLPAVELTAPEYPADALAGGAGDAMVAVRIFIDERGEVSRVEDSPKLASTPGPWAPRFREAVERTVRDWRFSGGGIRKVADGSDVDGDGKPDYQVQLAWRPLTVSYDLRFDFRVVDGKGEVERSGGPAQR